MFGVTDIDIATIWLSVITIVVSIVIIVVLVNLSSKINRVREKMLEMKAMIGVLKNKLDE